MKPRYQPLSQKQDHVESYLKSLRHSSYVVVEYKLMRCNIAEFKIITDLGGRPVSTEKKKSVTEYLQGEFCDVSVFQIVYISLKHYMYCSN